MAIDFTALRAKFIAAIRNNKTHDVIILVPQNVAPVDPLLPHRVAGLPPLEYPSPAIVSDLAVSGDRPGPSDKNCIVPGDLDVVPDDSMRLRFADDSEFSIHATQVYDQGGLAIGYKMRLKAWPTSSAQQT